MESLVAEFTPATALPLQVILVRLIGSIILVAGIGLEREIKERDAGLRTHMLVSLSAAMFAIVSIEVVASPVFHDEQVRADPLRVIEAVTAGVAFLSAGFIIVNRGQVRGVTTGAGIWLAAAIGLATGFGYWLIALMASILGIVIMFVLRKLERAAALKD